MDTEGPCADPDLPDLLPTWEAVDAAMDQLFDADFRGAVPDSHGRGLRIGWFFLTWTGFRTNPRERAFGYHAVRDHYLARWGRQLDELGDEQCWHYHHPAASGVGNEWGTVWSASDEYARILSRQLVERDWFPSCFRAGGTILTPESSRWVDAWFPADYSNRAPLTLPGLVDWSDGVAEWTLYHPSPERFTRPGHGRRRMARCLDLATSLHTVSEDDVDAAFARAGDGKPAILACFDHDYRDIAPRVREFCELVASVARRRGGEWRYAAPTEAIREFLGVTPRSLVLEGVHAGNEVRLWSSEPLFQPFPWLAVRLADGDVVHVETDVERLDPTRWSWQLPAGFAWEEVVAGGSSDIGESAVARITRGSGLEFAPAARAHPTRPRSIWEYTHPYTQTVAGRAAGREPEMDAARQAAEILRDRLEPGASVLDVGSGGGHLARSLDGFEYHGIDAYARAVEIGRLVSGVPAQRLRALALHELPLHERYDAVVSLSTLLYFPDFREPLAVMAAAAERLLVVRSSFGERSEIRYLPDPLLDPGWTHLRAYFSIFSRDAVEAFLDGEGFDVEWQADRRQAERFGGEPEVVGGIPMPYEFLIGVRR
jgi:SAM-dependent methyltransferase